jgi:hypothetical protein
MKYGRRMSKIIEGLSVPRIGTALRGMLAEDEQKAGRSRSKCVVDPRVSQAVSTWDAIAAVRRGQPTPRLPHCQPPSSRPTRMPSCCGPLPTGRLRSLLPARVAPRRWTPPPHPTHGVPVPAPHPRTGRAPCTRA